MALLRLQQKLAQKGLDIFTLADFRRCLELSQQTTLVTLSRYVKQGAIVRLRNGLYSFSWRNPNLFLVANLLYSPSYISYETALSYHHLIPETVYAYTSATPRRTQEFEALHQSFIYHAMKRKAFTGYRGYKIGKDTILMAEPEKALCDYLHLIFFKRKSLNERMDWRKINTKKLVTYAQLFKPKNFAKWVKNVIPG
ncbi:MAG: type IV toxin-antitoxin system AbiEi family antitoxin domain-containing protein [Elusimicrobia bacterium]|nr:type IV toxin-antitoxin system AbiEi family antitoxin domain-containing protein [Elusimicrobiota bacterium]